ncbi:MAG: hypothetical protein KAV82_16700 [Phycisphaerae bacterium]|nr:hypothetical protein [Phycisphaerae bacterium]
MTKRGFNGRLLRLVMALTLGGSMLQLGSCDPTVRSTLLTGLETTSQSLASTVIQAFFVSLVDDGAGSSSTSLTTP